MLCRRCRVHFSGSEPGSKCPYCGSDGEEDGPPDAARTRTEAPPPAAGAPPDERWRPGTIVAGKYEVLEILGSGGFGTVYKVRHLVRKKHYALKTPHADLGRNEAFRRRFEREIEAMERFTHPDAVTIRDSGITEALRPYYTMDFIEGESLKAVLSREGRMPAGRAVAIATRVLKVLDVAHSHRIVHRDIKPDNVMLTQAGGRDGVKVLDFGVAKLLDIVNDSGGTSQSLRVGTPRYMSPEQITGEPVGAASDLFAIGLVLYEMVTGTHPFAQGSDPIRVTAAILHRQARAAREIVPEMPRQLGDIIMALIEKSPRRRPESAAAVLRELQEMPVSSSRAEAIEPISVTRGAPRAAAQPMVLRTDAGGGERRAFLFFAERLQFGRGNHAEQGIANEWILRCLPCRSAAQDPEAWQRNLTISHRVGWVSLDGSVVVFEAAPDCKHGIAVGGVRGQRVARVHADRFHIALGDRALELDGSRVLRGPGNPGWDLGALGAGRPAGVEAPPASGFSNPAARVDSVSFFRAGNWPLHEYHWVQRQLAVGSSASAALRLRADGVEATHAAIVFEAGEAFLLALAPGIRVRSPAAGGREAGELDLSPRTLLPLAPGIEIMIARAALRLDRAEEALFKTV